MVNNWGNSEKVKLRLNNKFSQDEKKVLLQLVFDDATYEALKNSPKKINEAFDINLSNIIIATSGKGEGF